MKNERAGSTLLMVALWVGLSGCLEAKIKGEPNPKSDASASACADDSRLGKDCYAGQGDCRQRGVFVCSGSTVVCGAEAKPAVGPELCGTERDEDCDGTVDEAPETGGSRDNRTQGGSCVDAPEARDHAAVVQTVAEGVASGGGLTLRLRVGGPTPKGTMTGSGHVLRLGLRSPTEGVSK